MFRKVLIANRGEIAVRIAATCQAMGIAAAAVYSDADAVAMHVRIADESYRIGPAPAGQSYLDIPAIMAAAGRAGADALHPGYGFVSENPALAEACSAAGIAFVGPDSAAMRLVGSKIAAKRLAEEAGVPTVPGYHGDDQGDEVLLARAREIGPPLLIKAAAGGGGRGMRVVRDLTAFGDELAAARREAGAAFGDDTMLLERLIDEPRHVEFQIVGDARGHIVHLGERECSIQRRHQKIVEEAPSPVLTPALRDEMGAAAVRVARAAGYRNAGTVEFMLAPDGRYYFLEMNARLQVEHPVTELVTGLDLVALQLRLAAGEPLELAQEDVTLRGHALECRLYAEDPASGFLPSTGRLLAFAIPRGPGVRLDAGVEAGDEVTVHYDPMLAKLVTAGATRAEAVRRAQWALSHAAILGVTTNAAFLDRILRHPAFVAGDLSTAFLERHLGADVQPAPPPDKAVLLAALSEMVETAAEGYSFDPWRATSGWTPCATRALPFECGDARYAVALARSGAGWSARLGDNRYEVTSIARGGDGGLTAVQAGGAVLHGYVTRRGHDVLVAVDGQSWTLHRPAPPDVDAVKGASGMGRTGRGGQGALRAPMPGTIIRVLVREGDRVAARQRLAVLEAMKMEHAIEAPYAGIVRAVFHREGDLVPAGADLIAIDGDG